MHISSCRWGFDYLRGSHCDYGSCVGSGAVCNVLKAARLGYSAREVLRECTASTRENNHESTWSIGGGSRGADKGRAIRIWCTLLCIAGPPMIKLMLNLYQAVSTSEKTYKPGFLYLPIGPANTEDTIKARRMVKICITEQKRKTSDVLR